jgi:hypothetical protein
VGLVTPPRAIVVGRRTEKARASARLVSAKIRSHTPEILWWTAMVVLFPIMFHVWFTHFLCRGPRRQDW